MDFSNLPDQIVSGIITALSVYIGAWLAFRFGVKQVRRERAIDRRVEWHENLLAAAQDYRSNAQFLMSTFNQRHRSPEENQPYKEFALAETTEAGRKFRDLLNRSDLYGSSEEQDHAKRLAVLQLGLYVSSWSAMGRIEGESHDDHFAKLTSLVADLEQEEAALVQRLRRELEIPLAKRKRVRSRAV